MEVPESNHQPNQLPSLGENEEEYLRLTWGKLGVGQDGYLDQTQLALVCECIGMEKLSDEVIGQLFDKLDLDHDGRISFGEFLHLFQNVRPGKGDVPLESESYETNNWGLSPTSGRKNTASVRSEMLMSPNQTTMALFSNIDPGGTGFATLEATVECLTERGLRQAAPLLEALHNYHPSQSINLRELVGALQEEMNAGLEAGLLVNSGPAGTAIHAGILIMQHELSSVRLAMEHASRECEKLKSDLQEANQRSSLLAQEVDENHAKQETIRRSQFKQMEQRHADQLRMVQEVAQAERDQLVSQLQQELDKRLKQLQQVKEEEARLKEQAVSMGEDNARLLAENALLTEKLASTERANDRLLRELDSVSKMAEYESRHEALEESQRNSMTEQLNRLTNENLQLRDRTDELSAELEQLRGQLALAKLDAINGFGNAWRSEPTVSGAVKRRSDGDGEDSVDRMEDSQVNHAGKLRKKEVEQTLDALLRPSAKVKNGWGTPDSETETDESEEVQDLATQLERVKQLNTGRDRSSSGSVSTIKEQLKRVFEKLRLQIVEEFLEGNDSVAALQSQYRSVLDQQEERHVDEKRSLIETHLLKLSAVEAQLAESQIRIDDLVQLQTVMEAEHEMEVNDLRQQLKRIHTKDTKQEEYENLTEALADLDAALEKELGKSGCECEDANVYSSAAVLQSEENSSKVEKLEKQCKTLESELDSVKIEIVKILRDNEELRLKVKRQQEELEAEQKEADLRMEEKVEYETALLQQRIKKLLRENEEEKQRHIATDEDRKDLESRLDMLRQEFERLDDYWQSKMDEERELYDQERDSTDERFRALESKIKEYEELLGQGDASSTSSLSTIEERANWEKQLNDLEEESQFQQEQIASMQSELDRVRREKAAEVERFQVERNQLQTELQETKSQLQEVADKEEKLRIKVEQMLRSSPVKSPPLRPISPTPNPAILPSGYKPLESKGWSKAQLQRSSPVKSSTDPIIDVVDARKSSLSRSPSLNSATEQRFCRVDITVFQGLNARLKQQEQRCKELFFALQQQKQRTEQIMLETKFQHQEEIHSLELMMNASQETMRQMKVNHQLSLKKLEESDLLIMDLYAENTRLLQAMQMKSNGPGGAASGLSM